MIVVRIGFVCYQVFKYGGIQEYSHQLINRFVGWGHEVVLFSPPSGARRAAGLDSKVKLITIPVSPIPFTAAPSFWVQLPHAVRRAGLTSPFDVLHSSATDDVLLANGNAAKAPRVVTVYHLGASVARTARAGHFRRLRALSQEYGPAMAAEAVSIQRADAVVAISNFTRLEILRHYPTVDPNRVTTIYCGIRRRARHSELGEQSALRARWRVESDQGILLFVGRLEERKGLRFLFQALSRRNGSRGVRLLVVGAGDPTPYRRLAEKLGIAETVEFAGYLTDSELSAAYAIADAVVQPSLMEGYGFAAAEAVVQGIPVVATKVGGVPEVIQDGVDGILVEYGDAEGFATAIDKLLDSSQRKRTPALGGHRNLESWDRCAKETLNLYETLVEGRQFRSHDGQGG